MSNNVQLTIHDAQQLRCEVVAYEAHVWFAFRDANSGLGVFTMHLPDTTDRDQARAVADAYNALFLTSDQAAFEAEPSTAAPPEFAPRRYSGASVSSDDEVPF